MYVYNMAQLHAAYKKITLNIQPEKVKSKLIEKYIIFQKKIVVVLLILT